VKIPWPGFNEQQTVIIPLGKSSFDVADHPVIVQGEQFKPKDELHITLIGKRLARLLLEKIAHYPEIEMQLEKAFQNIDWSFKQTGPIHILAHTKDKMGNDGVATPEIQKSIILQLGMPGMAAFYDYLKSRDLIGSAYPVPPPHVTLYTRNCPGGIGVSSVKALNELSRETFSINSLRKLCMNQ
jgi:hypothetical protein